MSYLLKKLKEWKDKEPEEVKTLLYREGFASNKMDLYYEVKEFYFERIAYYKRRRINNPKMHANFETQKAFGISERQVYNCAAMTFD